MVDPGPDDPAHLDALAETRCGPDPLDRRDPHPPRPHAGGGGAGGAYRGGGHRVRRPRRFRARPRRGRGFELAGPDFTLRALHTPGHALEPSVLAARRGGTCSSPATTSCKGSTVVIAARPTGTWRTTWRACAAWSPSTPASPAIAPGHGALHRRPRRRHRGSSSTAWAREARRGRRPRPGAGRRHGRRALCRRSTPTSTTTATRWPASRCGRTCASWSHGRAGRQRRSERPPMPTSGLASA